VPEVGAPVLPKLEAAVAKASVSSELPPPPATPTADELSSSGYQARLDAYDRKLVEAALEQAGGSIREASRRLGISRNGLRAKIRRYGL
jgi:DNA-binding NtrC family response regulator